jgi:hypothetical protein
VASETNKVKGKRASVQKPARKVKLVQNGKSLERKGIDMLALCGKLTITVDPLEYQRASRGDE